MTRFYSVAHDLLFVQNDANRLFFYAKLQMVFVGILLGLFVYLWSRELFGPAAAAVSLLLFGLDPNILAHSGIIHTDLPFAAVYFIGSYLFYRLLQNFNLLNLGAAAVCFGLATVTKYSYVWILPAWLVLGLIKILSAEPIKVTLWKERLVSDRGTKASLVALGSLGCVVVAYVMLWGVYGFRFSAAGGGEQSFEISALQQSPAYGTTLLIQATRYHLFPESWVYGQLYVLSELKRNMSFFGEVSNQGFWLYFPVAFLVKTPLPTIVILFAAIGAWMKNSRWRGPVVTLLAPAFVYFVVAVAFRFNIGVRHLLPVYPFLFVLVGGFVAHVWHTGSRMMRSALGALAVWSCWSLLSVYPHLLAYFNELAGGPKNGHKVLLDSNLDWGQDLVGLKKWMDAQGVKKIQLFYFGTAEPRYYGIDDFYATEKLLGQAVAEREEIDLPEHFAISANFLFGRELFLPQDMVKLLASYRLAQPIATIGHSIFVFKLDLTDAQVYENAAFLAARKGATDIAASLLKKAIRLNPASANAHYALAQIFKRQGKLGEAAQHYQEALRVLKAGRQAASER
jgi:hypothetical protein